MPSHHAAPKTRAEKYERVAGSHDCNGRLAHLSDCALCQGPAEPLQPCDCGAEEWAVQRVKEVEKRINRLRSICARNSIHLEDDYWVV